MEEQFKKVGGVGAYPAKIARIPHKNEQHSYKKQQQCTQNQQKDIKINFEKSINQKESISLAKQRTKVTFFAVLLCFVFGCLASIATLFAVNNQQQKHIIAEGGVLTQDTDDYYMIADYADLCAFRDLVNGGDNCERKGFKLTANITIPGGTTWTPISTTSNMFMGLFDGCGYEIIMGTQSSPVVMTGVYCGLFGYLINATINNLIMNGAIKVTISSGSLYLGSIVGFANPSLFNNCSSKCNITYNTTSTDSNFQSVGSLIGQASTITMINCSMLGNINVKATATDGRSIQVGGLIGHISDSTIKNCYSFGIINATSNDDALNVGGVIGEDSGGSSIINCYNASSVSMSSPSNNYCGGIVSRASDKIIIANCYNEGEISAISQSFSIRVGGIAGSVYSDSTIYNCYNVGKVTGLSQSTSSSYGSYVGGISNNGQIYNCYNIGELVCVATSSSASINLGGIQGYQRVIDDSAYLNGSKVSINGVRISVQNKSYTSYGYKLPKASSSTGTIYENDGSTTTTDESKISFLQALWNTSNSTYSLTESHFSNNTIWSESNVWDFQNVWEIIDSNYPTLKEKTIQNIDITEKIEYINNITDLKNLSLRVNSGDKCFNKTFKMTNNITITDEWEPIGISGACYFAGIFDGCEYEITYGDISNPVKMNYHYSGLFGYVKGGEINHLTTNGYIEINKNGYFSPIVGNAITISLNNCYNKCNVVVTSTDSSATILGGIIGYSSDTATINNCYNSGDLYVESSSTTMVGGVGGNLNYPIFNNCSNSGNLSITSQSSGYAGGIMGDGSNGTIVNCYSVGDIIVESNSSMYAGGIAGAVNSFIIETCYNMGNISAFGQKSKIYVAGITGYATSMSCYNCFNIGNIEGLTQTTSTSYGVYAGGISAANGTIYNSYNVGAIICAVTKSSAKQYIGGIYANGGTAVNCAYLNGVKETLNGVSLEIRGSTYTIYGYKLPKASSSTDIINENDGSTTTTDENKTSFLQALWNVSNGDKRALQVSNFESDIWSSAYPWDFNNVWKIDFVSGFPTFVWVVTETPTFSTQLTATTNLSSEALLFITSEDQAFTLNLSAGNNSATFTLPKLEVGRLYVIRVYNGTLSGTLRGSGATVTQSPYYTFVCDTVDATINLSGLKITN